MTTNRTARRKHTVADVPYYAFLSLLLVGMVWCAAGFVASLVLAVSG